DDFLAQVESLTMGDVGSDLSLFMGAVIDERAFAKHSRALEAARGRPSVRVLTGGQTGDSEGYFVPPALLECSAPARQGCSPPSTRARSPPSTSTTPPATARGAPRPPTLRPTR